MDTLSLLGIVVALAVFIFMSIKRFPSYLNAAVAAGIMMYELTKDLD